MKHENAKGKMIASASSSLLASSRVTSGAATAGAGGREGMKILEVAFSICTVFGKSILNVKTETEIQVLLNDISQTK
eukprot:3792650-Ditylum_brightwellii.AAC.1